VSAQDLLRQRVLLNEHGMPPGALRRSRPVDPVTTAAADFATATRMLAPKATSTVVTLPMNPGSPGTELSRPWDPQVTPIHDGDRSLPAVLLVRHQPVVTRQDRHRNGGSVRRPARQPCGILPSSLASRARARTASQVGRASIGSPSARSSSPRLANVVSSGSDDTRSSSRCSASALRSQTGWWVAFDLPVAAVKETSRVLQPPVKAGSAVSRRPSYGAESPLTAIGVCCAPDVSRSQGSGGQCSPVAPAAAAVIADASGLTTAPATNTVGVALTPSAVARAVTYGGQSR